MQASSQREFVRGALEVVRWIGVAPNAKKRGVAPQCVQSCKNIDHGVEALASLATPSIAKLKRE